MEMDPNGNGNSTGPACDPSDPAGDLTGPYGDPYCHLVTPSEVFVICNWGQMHHFWVKDYHFFGGTSLVFWGTFLVSGRNILIGGKDLLFIGGKIITLWGIFGWGKIINFWGPIVNFLGRDYYIYHNDLPGRMMMTIIMIIKSTYHPAHDNLPDRICRESALERGSTVLGGSGNLNMVGIINNTTIITLFNITANTTTIIIIITGDMEGVVENEKTGIRKGGNCSQMMPPYDAAVLTMVSQPQRLVNFVASREIKALGSKFEQIYLSQAFCGTLIA